MYHTNSLPVYFVTYGPQLLLSAHHTEEEAREAHDGADSCIEYFPPGSLFLDGHTWCTLTGDPLVYQDAVPWLE